MINLMDYSYRGWRINPYALSHLKRLNRLIILAPTTTCKPARLKFS